jgi:hypothetical protein
METDEIQALTALNDILLDMIINVVIAANKAFNRPNDEFVYFKLGSNPEQYFVHIERVINPDSQEIGARVRLNKNDELKH